MAPSRRTLRIFVSFEFDKDGDLKDNFYAQAKELNTHRVRNFSLNEAYPDAEWVEKARSAIKECDVVIVLVGADTHNAPGVRTEVKIARDMGKPILQVRPRGGHTMVCLSLTSRSHGGGRASTESWMRYGASWEQSGGPGLPLGRGMWIPAFAGMTERRRVEARPPVVPPLRRGDVDCGFHRNDGVVMGGEREGRDGIGGV